MATCAKCSAELIGSAKFCASCGAQVSAPVSEAPATVFDPGTNIVNIPAAPAADDVNPFAATASPNSAVSVSARAHLASVQEAVAAQAALAAPADIGPKRGSIAPGGTSSRPPPGEGSPISPLAVSNALSQRGAFQQAVENAKEKARLSAPPPAPATAQDPTPKKKPGTQMMQNAPLRRPGPEPTSPAPPPAAQAAPAKKAPPRTVAMNFGGRAPPSSVGGAPQSVFPGGVPSSASQSAQPHSVIAPSQVQAHHAAPASVVQPSQAASYAAQPPAPYAAAPYSAQAPATPGGWTGWGTPAAQAPGAPYAYGYSGYAPGARVHVTWSNGQRYPATIGQVAGTQCLVVFPDGQQHWVEMQYLSPG